MKVLCVTATKNNIRSYNPAFGGSPDMTPDEMGQRAWEEALKADERETTAKQARIKSLKIKTKRNANIRGAQKELRTSVQKNLQELVSLLGDRTTNLRLIQQFFGSLPDSGNTSKLRVGYFKRVVMDALKKA